MDRKNGHHCRPSVPLAFFVVPPHRDYVKALFLFFAYLASIDLLIEITLRAAKPAAGEGGGRQLPSVRVISGRMGSSCTCASL